MEIFLITITSRMLPETMGLGGAREKYVALWRVLWWLARSAREKCNIRLILEALG